MRRHIVVMIALLALAARARAAAPASKPLPEILHGLSSEDFATREAAQRELAKIPPEQVQTLRDAAKGAADQEAKARLQARIAEMDLYLLMHPKPFFIDVQNASLNDVLKVLNDQAGGDLILTPGRNGPSAAAAQGITLKLQDAPLWEILRQVNEIAPFSVPSITPLHSPGASLTTFSLTPLAADAVARPFVVADGIAMLPQVTGNAATGNWTLHCMVYLDPHLRVGRSLTALRVEKALDQDGRSLSLVAPADTSASPYTPPVAAFGVRAIFAAAPGVTAIKELRGTAIMEILESQKTYKIDLTKAQIDSLETPTAKVTIERTAGGFRLSLASPDAALAARGTLPFADTPSIGILVKDAGGTVLQNTGATGAGIKLGINRNATTVEITTADKSREVTLPIVLKDVPIPAIPERIPFKNWTSANGQYVIKVVETTQIINGVPSHIDQQTKIRATRVLPGNIVSIRWDWSRGYFPVASAILADSEKLVVLVKTLEGTPLNARGEDYSPQAEIIILDNQGKEQATVGAGPWWKALGDDGKVSPNNPPKLKLLDNDKTVEITLASGKTVRVNTDSGEFSVVKGTDTIPTPASAPAATHEGAR